MEKNKKKEEFITLDADIFKWLMAISILRHHPKFKLVNNQYVLDKEISELFVLGIKFVEIIKKLYPILTSDAEATSNSLKTLSDKLKFKNTPTNRLYNWNLIQQEMLQLGIVLDDDVKQLIILEDCKKINEFLKEIYLLSTNKLEKLTQQSNISQKSQDRGNQQNKNNKISQLQINVLKELNETQSIIELLLVSLCQNLNLSTTQASAIIQNSNKYLAHILIKGLKSNFQPIANWLQSLYINTKHICELMSKDELSIPVFLEYIKPSFVSKDEEIALWGINLVGNIAYQLQNKELLPCMYNWFCQTSQSGLSSLLLALQRHPQIYENVSSLMTQIGIGNFIDLFTVQLRKFCQNSKDYLKTITILIKPLLEYKFCKEELINTGVIDFWVDFAKSQILEHYLKKQDIKQDLKELQLNSGIIEQQSNSASLLCEIWKHFSTYIEQQQQGSISKQILSLMKKCTRNRSQIIKFVVISKLFNLLYCFAEERNSFAPVIYKLLAFTLLENYDNYDVRYFLMHNFILVFKQFPNIPSHILLYPFIKMLKQSDVSQNDNQQINEKKHDVNLIDLQFLNQCTLSQKIDEQLAVQLLDLLTQLYIQQPIFSQIIFTSIQSLLQRFIFQKEVEEYLIKLIKAILKIYLDLYIKFPPKNPKDYEQKLNYQSPMQPYKILFKAKQIELQSKLPSFLTEQDIIQSNKRALLIQLLKSILSFKNENVYNLIDKDIVSTYLQIEKRMKLSPKQLFSLLAIIGDPHRIIQSYRQQSQSQLQEQFYDQFIPDSLNFEQSAIEKADSQLNIQDQQINMILNQELGEDEKQNLKRQGIGLKKKRNLQKNELSSLQAKVKSYQSANETVPTTIIANSQNENLTQNQKAILNLQKLKQKKLQQEISKQMKVEEEKIKQDKNLREVQKQIQIRNLALGVKNDKITPTKNTQDWIIDDEFEEKENPINSILQNKNQEFLVFEINNEQSNQNQIKEVMNLFKDNYTLFDIIQEEDFEKASVNQELRKRKKQIKFLFFKYAKINSQANSQQNYFGTSEFKKENKSIGQNEIIRFLNDIQLHKQFQSKQFINNVLKCINPKDLQLDFNGFVEFLIQISVIASSFLKSELNQTMGQKLASLFNYIDTALKANNDFKTYFDVFQNDKFTTVEEKQLNTQLEQNPNSSIPQEYQKILIKELTFEQNKLPNSLIWQLDLPYLICFDIINDIFLQKFKISLYEQKSIIKNIVKIKKKKQINPIKQAKITQEYVEEKANQKIQSQQNKNQIQQEQKQNLSIMSKNKNNTSSSFLERQNKFASEQNLTFEQKTILEQKNKNIKEKSRENSRIQRKNELNTKLEELRNLKKLEEIEKAKQVQEKQQQLSELQKQKEEQLQKEQTERKLKIKAYYEEQERLKKEKDEKVINESKNAVKQQMLQQKKFLNKQTYEYSKAFEEIKQNRLAKMQEKQKIQLKEIEKENQVHKKIQQELIKEKEKREKDNIIKSKVTALYSSPLIQSIYKQYEKQLKMLFNNFAGIKQKDKVIQTSTQELLSYKGFMSFAHMFKIFPFITSQEQVQIVYRSLTKDKLAIDNVPIGLTYYEFLESLLRISLKEQGKLISQNIFPSPNQKIDLNESMQKLTIEKDAKDEYEILDDISKTQMALQEFIKFLDLKKNKGELAQKLRELDQNKNTSKQPCKFFQQKNQQLNLVSINSNKGNSQK